MDKLHHMPRAVEPLPLRRLQSPRSLRSVAMMGSSLDASYSMRSGYMSSDDPYNEPYTDEDMLEDD